MPLNPINLKANEEIKEKVRFHLMQIEVLPAKFEDFFDGEYQEQQEEIVKRNLRNLRITRNSDTRDIIIFPELSIPNSLESYLRDISIEKKAFIIAGFFYNEQNQNKCKIFDPEGNIHEQYKLNIAQEEDQKVHKAHEQLDKKINVFVDTPIGDFAVLICYDFTDPLLLTELRGKTDHLIIITMNKAVERFGMSGIANARDNFYYITICNTADYGGSAIYGPFTRDKDTPVCYISPGEERVSKEINLSKFRIAANNQTRPCHGYSKLPSRYKRGYEWWKNEPSALLDNIFIEWESLHDNLIGKSEETVNKFRENLDKFKGAMTVAKEHLKGGGSPQPIIQLEYLLEDLKKQFEVLKPLVQFTETSFRTGGNKFTDLNDIKYDFLSWNSFINKFNLDEKEIKKFISDVSTSCVNICEGYPDVKLGYNVVSRRAAEKFILITRTNVDKRKIENYDVVVVALNKVEKKTNREIIHYWYTNTSDDRDIRPSQETHLSYEIHGRVSRAETLLHFHHNNILEQAWSIPFTYGDKIEQYDVPKIPDHPTPTLLGRNVEIKVLADKMVEKFNDDARIFCIIGVRHGAWVIEEDFEKCLKKAGEVEYYAGINKDPKMGQKILKSIIEDFESIRKNYE